MVARPVQPRAVLVNTARVWPGVAQGVILPGILRGWYRTQCGDWLGRLDTAVRIRGGADLPLTMLVWADALRPANMHEPLGVLDFSIVRPKRPALPVVVNPFRLWPPRRFRWAVETALFVKSQGVNLRDPAAGVLRGWVRAAGGWLGHVDWAAQVQGEAVALSALLPAAALQPAGQEQVAGRSDVQAASVGRPTGPVSRAAV